MIAFSYDFTLRNTSAAETLGIQVGAEIAIRPVNAKGPSK